MAFVTLEDLTGQVECLLFPRVFERLGDSLEVDGAYLFTGRLSVTEDRPPSLLVESARPMEKAGPRRIRPQAV